MDGSTFVYSDLLIWTLKEGSAENWAQEISPSGSQQTINVLSAPFNWNAGVRLGVGYDSNDRIWDTVASYTWFNANASSSASVTSGGIYSPYLGNFFVNNTNGASYGPNYYNASVNWKLKFNIFDLELGHKFKVDQFLMFRPFIGLKGGFIYQNINTFWQNPTIATTFRTATEQLKNDFAGIGPSLGVNSTWQIYNTTKTSFNFIGNVSGAILWGHWRFKDIYTNNANTTVAIQTSNIKGASPMARGLIGIEWSNAVGNSCVSIRLGYEAQIWFNQIQYYSYNMGRLNNLMSLQGGVLGFSINL